ncbi:MAG: tRNA 2-thiocytidine biosynthesis protein TtcA [Bacteroidales bacterium]|nr:tRNA 2-thiocytidine biosynthesis protein TtcA [Bacteroidales bacterium]
MNNKFINTLNTRIGRTIIKQKLITGGDRVLVALSGGKDSLVLLEALADRKRHFPFKFDLYAAHITIKGIGYKTDVDYLKSLCNELGVEFVNKEAEIGRQGGKKKTECFLCSWHRRKALFALTKQLNCNKLAFGHHMDDAVETLLMNMVFHGSVSSMPFEIEMFDGRVKIIRPMLEISESEIKEYEQLKKFRKEVKICPFSNNKRAEMKDLLKNISKIRKNGLINIFRSMDNIYLDYLPHWKM